MKYAFLAAFVLIPFAISGAFYLSPWVGVPALFIGGFVWLATIQLVAEL